MVSSCFCVPCVVCDAHCWDCAADIALWGGHLRDGLALGGGSVSEEAFLQALELRAKRVQMRSVSGQGRVWSMSNNKGRHAGCIVTPY